LRGGYGAARILEAIDWPQLARTPKWLCGYSDATALLCGAARAGVQSLHAEMAVNFPQADAHMHPGTESLRLALLQGAAPLVFSQEALRIGTLPQAEAVGGNLSVLYSLLGSPTFPDTEGKILFLEDLDEYAYHLDRMFTALKRASVLRNLAGLVIGSFTSIHDNAVPWGHSLHDIVLDAVGDAEFPVWFGAPIGHTPNNQAVVMGGMLRSQIEEIPV
jgi:muramoyltetrapeptide carboxypeptidase